MKIGLCGPIDVPYLAKRLGVDPPPSTSGFGSTIIPDLAIEYLARGHQVSIFTLSQDCVDPHCLQLGPIKLHVGRSRRKGWQRWTTVFGRERADLLRALQADPCDVFHVHWLYEFALPTQHLDTPALLTAHDAPWTVIGFYKGLKTTPYFTTRALMATRVVSRLKHLSVVSPYLEDYYRQRHGVTKPIHVVPNGLPDSQFALERTRKFAADGFRFAAILNGFDTRKNASTLLQAWPVVRQRLPGAQLRLYGAGQGEGEACQAWVSGRFPTDGVEFRGKIPYLDLQHQLAAEIDALVHPALEECCPMGIIEAMTRGLPCIGGRNAGGVAWTIGDGNGILIDPLDPDDMARAMIEVASSPARCQELGRRARAEAEKRFKVSAVAGTYLEILTRIAAKA